MLPERWLNNNLGLLTAAEIKVLSRLLKSRRVKWHTVGTQCDDLPEVTKQGGNKVGRKSVPLPYSGWRAPIWLMFFFSVNERPEIQHRSRSHPKRDTAEGGLVRHSKAVSVSLSSAPMDD